LTGDAFTAFSVDELTEDELVRLMHVGLDPVGEAQWPEAAAGLPIGLQGPVAYVLYKYSVNVLQNPASANVFLAALRQEAALAPKDSVLARLVGEKLK
jgi:hypothetical protein